jgi:hypothetical protein
MEENIGLVVLEHLCDKLNVHILNVDLLYTFVNNGQDGINIKGYHTWRLLFMTIMASFNFSCSRG